MSNNRIVTVFGGTGFLGRRIVRHLAARGFPVRIASRHPDRAHAQLRDVNARIELLPADVHDDATVAAAVDGAYGALNAVSLYVERRGATFQAVHVEAAARVARQARERSVERLIHISGIGADPRSPSPYIRSRGEGEAAVRAAFAGAIIVRPAVMFGPDDAFLRPILHLLRRLPVFPIFGRGLTRLQPAYVEDVAEAVSRCLERADLRRAVFECAGPQVYSYANLLRSIAKEAGLSRLLIPVPFWVWHALAFCAEFLPTPPVTRNQVELMEIDNVATPGAPSFAELGISPIGIEQVTRELVDAMSAGTTRTAP